MPYENDLVNCVCPKCTNHEKGHSNLDGIDWVGDLLGDSYAHYEIEYGKSTDPHMVSSFTAALAGLFIPGLLIWILFWLFDSMFLATLDIRFFGDWGLIIALFVGAIFLSSKFNIDQHRKRLYSLRRRFPEMEEGIHTLFERARSNELSIDDLEYKVTAILRCAGNNEYLETIRS